MALTTINIMHINHYLLITINATKRKSQPNNSQPLDATDSRFVALKNKIVEKT